MAMTTADIKLTVFMLNAEQAMNLSQGTEKRDPVYHLSHTAAESPPSTCDN
jgi:hypothetical protein